VGSVDVKVCMFVCITRNGTWSLIDGEGERDGEGEMEGDGLGDGCVSNKTCGTFKRQASTTQEHSTNKTK
jgi:hypothetical protein